MKAGIEDVDMVVKWRTQEAHAVLDDNSLSLYHIHSACGALDRLNRDM